MNPLSFGSQEQIVLWAVSYLTGTAYDWISTHLKDYLAYSHDKREDETNAIFDSHDEYVSQLTRMFGNTDEEIRAERDIQSCKQLTSVTEYTGRFELLAGKVDWEDKPLRALYYKGLKEEVKDDIVRGGRPQTLTEMKDKAIEIDTRLYERRMERRGQYSLGFSKKQHPQKPRYHSPMELDAFQGKPKQKSSLSKEEMQRRKDKNLCFECGLPGHMASSHRQKQQSWRNKKQLNTTGRGGYNSKVSGRKEIAVLEAKPTEEELERQKVHTQLETHCDKCGMACSASWKDKCPGCHYDEDSEWEESCKTMGEFLSQVDGAAIESESDEDWDIGQELNKLLHISEEEEEELHKALSRVDLDDSKAPSRGYTVAEPEELTPERRIEIINQEILKERAKLEAHRQEWRAKDRARWEAMLAAGTVDESERNNAAHHRHPQHGTLHWTACYTDHCLYHLDAKQASHFPKRKRMVLLKDNEEEDKKELCTFGSTGQLSTNVRLGKNKLVAMIDSGATGNFISPEVIKHFGISTQVKNTPYTLTVADGTDASYRDGLVDIETVRLRMDTGDHMEWLQLDVTQIGRHEIILGMPWITKHNPTINWQTRQLVFDRCQCVIRPQPLTSLWNKGQDKGTQTEELDQSQKEVCATSSKEPDHHDKGSHIRELPSEYEEFKGLFSEEQGPAALPEHKPWDHEIPLVDGAAPPSGPIYSLSEDDLRTLREFIDDGLKKGIIRESTSPAGASVLFVPKPDGTKRLCVDYRKLNDMTIKDRYALPRADEMRDRLQGAKIFTQLDLRDAYYSVRIKAGEEWKTAFRTRYGHYEFTAMPMGLTNAPATFQRLINNILMPFLDITCICYLDDILIYSARPEDHEKDVKAVMQVLQDTNLRVKLSKCRFGVQEVTFLGYVISTEGIKMDPAKIAPILEWNTPTCVKDVQSFVGFANFYRRFIKGYSELATPLTRLTKKDVAFEWTHEAQDAFDALKRAFTTAPVLIAFDPEKEITVETDASDYALGAVLSQPNAGGK
jgi:hypothetical protein